MMSGIDASMFAASVVLTPAAGPRDLFHDDRVRQARQPEAAVGLGDLEVHEAELERLVHDLGGELALLIEVSGDGRDLVACELAGGLNQRVLLVGERQIEHGASQAR